MCTIDKCICKLLTQIKIGVQIIGRLLVDHTPGQSHAGADKVRQRRTGLQAGILVQSGQHLIKDGPFDLAQWKTLGCLVQMMAHRAIQGQSRLAAALQRAVEHTAHLQHLALAHTVAQAKRKLSNIEKKRKVEKEGLKICQSSVQSLPTAKHKTS